MTDVSSARSPRSMWLVGGVVALVTLVAFAPALAADFVTWDDDTNFLRNPNYRGLGATQLRWMWTTTLLGHYVPLSWMTLGLDYALWGMDARGYHLTSLLIHAANAALLFRVSVLLVPTALGARAQGVRAAAALGALLFAVHPLRVESVAWITERRDVLSTFFVLLAVLAYLKHVEGGSIGRWYWLTLLTFVCALLAKATAVTLPAVILVMNIWPLRRLSPNAESVRRIGLELAPMFLISASAGALSLYALDPGPQLPLAAKVAVSSFSLLFYLWKTVVPTGLAPLYEMPTHVGPLEPRYLAGYTACAAFVGVWVYSLRRWPGAAAALAAAAIMILPLLGIVQNGVQIVADRYTYQAAQPIAVLLAGALALRWSRATFVAGVVAITVLGLLSWRQTTFWKNSEALWERVLAVDPKSSLAHTALANVFLGQNRLEEAVDHYRASLAINPHSLEADNNLGTAFARLGRVDEAIVHYRRALVINPSHYEAHNNLGTLLARHGQTAEAVAHFTAALSIKPRFPDAEVNWGNALLRAGRPHESIEHYQRALAMDGRAQGAEYNWGVALAQQGKYAEAIPHLEAAAAQEPDDEMVRETLAAARKLNREVEVRRGRPSPP